MAEYIEREAVLEILRKQSVGTWRGVPCYPDEISRTFREVSKIPAADVAPIRRGKWKLNKDGSGTCDQCHCTQDAVWDVDTWQNFCGHCGADMREVE